MSFPLRISDTISSGLSPQRGNITSDKVADDHGEMTNDKKQQKEPGEICPELHRVQNDDDMTKGCHHHPQRVLIPIEESYLDELPIPLPVKTSAIMSFHNERAKNQTYPGVSQFKMKSQQNFNAKAHREHAFVYEGIYNFTNPSSAVNSSQDKTTENSKLKGVSLLKNSDGRNKRKQSLDYPRHESQFNDNKRRFLSLPSYPSKIMILKSSADDCDKETYHESGDRRLPSIQDIFTKSILDKVDPSIVERAIDDDGKENRRDGEEKCMGSTSLPDPATIDQHTTFDNLNNANIDMHFIKTGLPNYKKDSDLKDTAEGPTKVEVPGDCNNFIHTLIIYLSNIHRDENLKFKVSQQLGLDQITLLNYLVSDFFKRFGLVPLNKVSPLNKKARNKQAKQGDVSEQQRVDPSLSSSSSSSTPPSSSSSSRTSKTATNLANSLILPRNLSVAEPESTTTLLGSSVPFQIGATPNSHNSSFKLEINFWIDGPPFAILEMKGTRGKASSSRKLYSFTISLKFLRFSRGSCENDKGDDGTSSLGASEISRIISGECDDDNTRILSDVDISKGVIDLLNGHVCPIKIKSQEEVKSTEEYIKKTRLQMIEFLKKNQVLLHSFNVEMSVSKFYNRLTRDPFLGMQLPLR